MLINLKHWNQMGLCIKYIYGNDLIYLKKIEPYVTIKYLLINFMTYMAFT